MKNIHTYEFADIKKVDHNFEEMKERIENTEKSILETRIQFINQLHGNEEIDYRFKELSNRISYFEKMINSLYFSSEKPNKCPVCEGKGNIK